MSAGQNALGVLRAEGPRAALDRALDRSADRRRAASFLEVSPASLADRLRGAVPVLNLLGVPLRRSGGGVELQFLARRAAAEQAGPTACLSPASGAWRLEATAGGLRQAVSFPGGAGEPPARHLARALRAAWALLAPRGLHVENPAGLDLGVLAEQALEMPLLLSLHDLSLFCPRPHLLPVTADGDCHWTAAGGCALCARPPEIPGSGGALASLLARARGLVFPSRFLSVAYASRCGALPRPQCFVVEPGVPLPERRPWRGTAAIRHLAYVGSVLPHKGAELLLELVPALHAAGLRVSAYGGGDRRLLAALRRAGVEAPGYYRAGTLPRRLARDGVDLVLLLSQWPESHSLTLDECIAAGVPVLAFDRGALGERLAHGGGTAVPPERGTEGLLEALAKLRAGTATTAPSTAAPPDPQSALGAMTAVYTALGWLARG